MEDNMRALRWTKVLLSLSGMSGGDGAVLALWLGAGTALLALCLAEVVVRDTFASRLETLFLLAGCAHIYSKQVNLALKRGGVGRLVAALEAAHTRTLPQPPPLARADRAAVNMILCSGAAMSFVFLATFGVTLSSYCFLSLEEPKLPYPFWVPFDPRQSYLLAYACQLVMVPTYVSYFTFFSLLITVTMYISGQLTFLARGLRNLPSANPHNSEIKEALVYYIRIHNDVIRLIDAANLLLSNVLAFELFINTVQGCLAAYQVVKLSVNFNKSLYNYSSFIVVLISPIFICCMGNEIETKYAEISNAAYEATWFEHGRDIKRNLHTIMLVASKPKSFNYRLVFFINMKRYTEVLQTAYSYYTVVQSLEK